MKTITVYVTIEEYSEWTATESGAFRGFTFTYEGEEYKQDKKVACYYVSNVDNFDVACIKGRLGNEREVLSFEVQG